LKLALPDSRYQFCVEGIGFGDNTNDVINTAQKFINQEEVVLTTGLLGHKGLQDIVTFFEDSNETLIYADFGTAKPLDHTGKNFIFCNSLNLYGATYALGKYFIEKGYKAIATSTCYYESGYGFIKAMEEALYENNDAAFSGHFITPLHPRENEAGLMSEFVSETKPDALFAFHNGIYAEEHASYLIENTVNKTIPFYTLPFSVDEKLLKEFPKIFHDTNYVSSWTLEQSTLENVMFVKDYTNRFSKLPSIFAVLGYENGLLIQNKLENENLPHKLMGPRGDLTSVSNRTNPKQYLWQLKWFENEYNRNFVRELSVPDISINTYEENNWYNTYLCH